MMRIIRIPVWVVPDAMQHKVMHRRSGMTPRITASFEEAIASSGVPQFSLSGALPFHLAELLPEGEALQMFDDHSLRPVERRLVGGLDAQREVRF